MKSIEQLISLKGRVAVITGGAGHLGSVMAQTLAELGCSICIVDHAFSNMSELCTALRSKNQIEARGIVVNLEKEQERIELVPKVLEYYDRVDILVNNAAFVGDSTLQGWGVKFEHQKIEAWRRALEVNLIAAFHLSQLFMPLLRIGRKGSIINIGSIYGVVGPDERIYEGTSMANPAAYAASKGGLIQLTRWLSTTLAPDIRVNSISPGGIARGQAEIFTKRYIDRTPLRRMGTEEDLKGAVAFFASDLSAWITGENLMVDGGFTAW